MADYPFDSDKLDYRVLSQPVSQRDIAEFRQQTGSEGVSMKSMITVGMVFWSICLLLMLLQFTGLVKTDGKLLWGAAFWSVLYTIGCFAYYITYREQVRLYRFARLHGLRYLPDLRDPQRNGMIFTVGHGRQARNIMSLVDRSGRTLFELGNMMYVEGYGRNRRTYSYTYLCIDMRRHLPHMVLDSTRNNLRLFGKNLSSSLPAAFAKDQRLQLEGDFNNYFTLYAPKEYERDALYIFTPEVMAAMIDTAAQFDAEVVDDKLYFYSQQPAFDEALLRRFFRVIQVAGAKFYRRSDYYADERLTDSRQANTVALAGKRLQKRGWFVAFVAIVISLLVMYIVQLLSH